MLLADPLPAQFAIQVRVLAETVGEDPAANTVPRFHNLDIPFRFLQLVPRCQSCQPSSNNHATFSPHYPSSAVPFGAVQSGPFSDGHVGTVGYTSRDLQDR